MLAGPAWVEIWQRSRFASCHQVTAAELVNSVLRHLRPSGPMECLQGVPSSVCSMRLLVFGIWLSRCCVVTPYRRVVCAFSRLQMSQELLMVQAAVSLLLPLSNLFTAALADTTVDRMSARIDGLETSISDLMQATEPGSPVDEAR